MSNGILSPAGQVSYPHLFSPQVFKGPDGKPDPKKEPQYSVTLVFNDPKGAEYAAFKKSVYEFIVAQRKGRPFPANFNWPWRDGTRRVNNDGEQIEGFTPECEYFRAWVKARSPENKRVDGTDKFTCFPVVGPNRSAIADPREVYAGSQGRVYVRPFEYKNYGNGPGCSLSLEAFQKVGEGDPIGPAPVRAEDVFSAIEGSDDLSSLIGGDDSGKPPWA